MKNWKTTVGGVLLAVGIGLRKNPVTAPYAEVVEAIGAVLLGASARDVNVTSSQMGLNEPKRSGEEGKTL